jgi:hypothetical protein
MNVTNSSVIESAPDRLLAALSFLDNLVRCYSIFIHLIFFVVLVFSKKLHTRELLYVNHCTIVNSFYSFMFFFYMFSDRPNFPDQTLNSILCSMSEIAWPFSHFIRMYSILLIAAYRFLAVFKMNIYKKVNDSIISLIIPIGLVWIISLGIPISLKKIFGTISSRIFCSDGNSDSQMTIIFYVCFHYLFVMIIPSVCIITIYILIILKLKKLHKKVNKRGQMTIDVEQSISIYRTNMQRVRNNSLEITQSANFTNASKPKGEPTTKKHRKFANQFIIMCCCVLAISFVTAIFSLRNVIENYATLFVYWRPVLRVYILCTLSIIPLISLYFHPDRARLMKKIFSKRKIANQQQLM